MQQLVSNLSVLLEAPIFNLGLLIDGVLKPSARQIRNRCMSKACPVAWASGLRLFRLRAYQEVKCPIQSYGGS